LLSAANRYPAYYRFVILSERLSEAL